MIDLRRENRLDVLRQVAQLQQNEIIRLRQELGTRLTELSRLKGDPTLVQHELLRLEERLARQERALFGRSSEATPSSAVTSIAHQDTPPKQPGHGPREQRELEQVVVEHKLDAADTICPSCGGELKEWVGQTEDAEEIDVVERRFVVVKHQRQKYRCSCGGCVETALGPTKLIPGGRYSVGFAVEVATAKYCDHLPLERQVRIMRREGLQVESQTLWDQIEALARLLHDVPDRIRRHLITKSVVGMDETPWPLLEKGNKTWQVWSLTGEDGVYHRIKDSRGHDVAVEILGDFTGCVMSDGYSAYGTAAAKANGRWTQAFCWAHVRRKFFEAQSGNPREANAIVHLINALFAIDQRAATGPPREHAERRARMRAEEAVPILAALACWEQHIRATVLPDSGLGGAGKYMRELWDGLVRFLADTAIPLSNNATERSLRGVTLGRKNHYGSKSKRGTQVAALFYTIVESAKLCGIDPKAYLKAAALAAINGKTVLLPHEMAHQLASAKADGSFPG